MSDQRTPRATTRTRAPLAALVALALAACVSTPPPVQEMSDARQAVEAAREAGAEQYAPQLFRRSVELLKGAQRTLEHRGYTQARNQALGARRLAMEAMKEAERRSKRGQ